MKLRIRGNSLRLRVSRPELEQIVERGFAEDEISFSPTARLRYRIEVRPQGAVQATLQDGDLTVALPKDVVSRWAQPTEIGVRGEQALGDGRALAILVEKDFECLGPTGEDQSDLFPNPLSSDRTQ